MAKATRKQALVLYRLKKHGLNLVQKNEAVRLKSLGRR